MFCCPVFASDRGDDVPACRAWIHAYASNGRIMVEAMCTAAQVGCVDYELISEKTGQSDKASSVQRGQKPLVPNEVSLLCRTTLSLSDQDVCRIELRVFRDGVLAAEQRMKIP